MLKRVHVAGVLALGLSGVAAAQTTTNPAASTPDQASPPTETVKGQPGSASFLTPQALSGTLTQHLAGAALLLHQEAALWPSLPTTVTVVAPVPEVTAELASVGGQAVSPSVPASSASATTELLPQAAPAPASFNEDTSAVPGPAVSRAVARATVSAPEAELPLPALPGASLISNVVDLALAPAPTTPAASQLARLRLLQAQNPRRPSAVQATPRTPPVSAAKPAPAEPVATRPAPVKPTAVKPAAVRAPVAQAVPRAPAPEAQIERAVPAPIIVVNVKVPAVSAPLATSPRQTSVAATVKATVKTAAPVKQITTAPKPASVKTTTIKPAAAKPAAAKPAPAKPVTVQRQAAPSSGPVVGATRGSLGRPAASGARRVVSATAYSSDVAQTDNSPFVTATGTRVRPGVIALSRDLLRTFPYGSRVTLQDSAGILNGRVFIVEDTMNARLRNTIDVWMGSRSQAYQWGRRTVTITAVR